MNEIIEWAEDISECGGEVNLGKWRTFTARYFDKVSVPNAKVKMEDFLREQCIIESTELGELIFSFAKMRIKSHYITKIAPKLGEDLQNAVIKLADDLEAHRKLLWKYMKDRKDNLESTVEEKVNELKTGIIKSDKYVEDIGNHKEQLDLSAQKVIEEATKIKTKDIG